MATQFIPKIAREDYQSFRQILDPHLPDTYDEWLDLVSQVTGDNIGRGRISETIEVNPDEFSNYCLTTRSSPNLHVLKNFAHQKGMRNKN